MVDRDDVFPCAEVEDAALKSDFEMDVVAYDELVYSI